MNSLKQKVTENENKHTKEDMVYMTSLPLSIKIAIAKNRIRDWYNTYDGQVYVARSGGKDSDVLSHLVKELYPDVPHVYCNTGLDYSTVRKHAQEECNKTLYPTVNPVQILTKYGYPIISKEVSQTIREARIGIKLGNGTYQYRIDKLNGTYIDPKTAELSQYNMPQWKFLLNAPFRISEECCNNSKKLPFKKYEKETGRKAFLGTTMEESRLRREKWIRYGCNAFEAERPTSQPLSIFTEQDILHYIKANNIKLASAYGDVMYTKNGMYYDIPLITEGMKLATTGCKRTGCTYCLFGITQEKDRLTKLKELEPKKYDYIMRGGMFDAEGMWVPGNGGLGFKFVIEWLNKNGNFNILV